MIWAFLVLLFASSSFTRDAKWFFPKRIPVRVLRRQVVVTSVVPSSCIVVDPTLQPCRSVRNLKIEPSSTTRIESTPLPSMVGPRGFVDGSDRGFELEATETERSGWGKLWQWQWPQEIVTKTVTAYETVRKYNTDAVVSIVVKGCQPTSLPFNLEPCENSFSNASEKIERELHYTNEE